MSNYQFNRAKYGTHQIILSLLGKHNLILDVGCGSGYLGFNSKENRFYGIDINKEEIKKARRIYENILIGDVEKIIKKSSLKLPKFDVIIFADILEHLVSPQNVLTHFVKKFLKNNGKVIISLPNIAHLSIRLNLLIGKFDYTEAGILDKTHLHFYTLKTAKKLINDSGLLIEKTFYSSNRLGFLIKIFPFLGKILDFNLIFLCKRKINK